MLKLLHRWRKEAGTAGGQIKRIAVAYEAGRDGFWLARWLRMRNVDAYVIHPTSVAVSREHRRAKTDRLDTELLMRAFIGWLRGEKRHCNMVAIPTVDEEDARRPNRERGNLVTEVPGGRPRAGFPALTQRTAITLVGNQTAYFFVGSIKRLRSYGTKPEWYHRSDDPVSL